MSDSNNGPTDQEIEDDEIDRAIERSEEALRGEHGEEAKREEEARQVVYDAARRKREVREEVQRKLEKNLGSPALAIVRISSVDLPHHPAYVAMDLRQVQKVCELIGTEDTVWSQEQIDTIGRRAAKGEFDMHTVCNRTTISFK